jgi:hypothetical protein
MMGIIGLSLARLSLASRHAMAAGALQRAAGAAIIDDNTPAKPMWTSVLTLKLRGFFIARHKAHSHPAQEVAP